MSGELARALYRVLTERAVEKDGGTTIFDDEELFGVDSTYVHGWGETSGRGGLVGLVVQVDGDVNLTTLAARAEALIRAAPYAEHGLHVKDVEPGGYVVVSIELFEQMVRAAWPDATIDRREAKNGPDYLAAVGASRPFYEPSVTRPATGADPHDRPPSPEVMESGK